MVRRAQVWWASLSEPGSPLTLSRSAVYSVSLSVSLTHSPPLPLRIHTCTDPITWYDMTGHSPESLAFVIGMEAAARDYRSLCTTTA